MLKRFLFTLFLLCNSVNLLGQEFSANPSFSLNQTAFLPVEEAYQVDVVHSNGQLQFYWTIQPAHYLYQHQFLLTTLSGEKIALEFPEGISKWDEYFQKELVVYYDSLDFVATLPDGTTHLLLQSQGCADAGLCYPPRTQKLTIDPSSSKVVVEEHKRQPVATAPSTPDSNMSFWLAIGFALIGGIILNLMPCVFPVLSIKILSFTNQAEQNQSKFAHVMAYTGGVVLTFIAFALAMLLLRESGEAIGWGFQLQSPWVICGLLFLFLIMGLALSDKLMIGNKLAQLGSSHSQSSGVSGSFSTGALAAIVASPCTAPFMGTALGYAITLPTVQAISIFAALGLGMAAPFVLLALIPALVNKLPKPGPWMDHFRQFMAFPLYLTCVWLLWVLANQIGTNAAALVGIALVILLFAVWLKNISNPESKKPTIVFYSLVLLVAIICSVSIKQSQQTPIWQPYSATTLAQLRDENRPVFVNLTADWCITCLINERNALSGDAFEQLIAQHNVAYLKGDWTRYDENITKLLTNYNRSGVPLYLYFPPGKPAEILPQILTFGIIEDVIGK